MRCLAVCALGAVLSLSSTPAQAPAEASSTENTTAVKAWEELAAVKKAVNTELEPLLKRIPDKQLAPEERQRLTEQMNVIRRRLVAPTTTFEAAFAAADWGRFDATANKDLLKAGLLSAARSEDATLALRAARLFLERFADDSAAKPIRQSMLPMALIGVGKVDEAVRALQSEIETADGSARVRLQMLLGDIAAARGDLAAAGAAYEAAEAVADKNTKGYVAQRRTLIGKPAPEIDSKSWIGADSKTLSNLHGKVVVVDFWATWCGPCRMVMPALSEMYTQKHSAGLEVIGVTHPYDYGYMPRTKAETRSGGESVRPIAAEDFRGHVEQFKKVTEIAYPFVIGTAKDFEAYRVTGIPALCVIDRDGKVVFVSVGSGSEALLRLAVETQLAAAAPTK